VWIIREGLVELFVGAGRKRQAVQLLRSGDVDGDIQVLLDLPFQYSARAATDTVALFVDARSFERLLDQHPGLARRWLTGVAARVSGSQRRIVGLHGASLTVQAARLLRDEVVDDQINLPQRTLAAMLGVQRPSLNKVLKELERRGLIAVGYSRITITDPDDLAALAG
jgi:CRP/FNR family transcriptional regulator, cAMP and macrophage regulator